MAFRSFTGSSRDAGTVTLTADTGQFNAQVEQAERQWRESISSMSREALKLELAEDRLRRSLSKYGAESNQAKRATIALKDAEEQATRATRQLDAAQHRAAGGFTRLRQAAFAAAGVGGIYGVVTALRSVTTAAKESELVTGQTKLAVEAAGQSWTRYQKQIENVIRAQSRLGFDDEKLMKTFSAFVTRTKDVSEALRLNALAADVARGRYIDLEQAAQIVLKASLGQSGALRRMGIDVDKNAKATELLARLTEAYGKRAEGAMGTATAATERMNVAIENAREVIGAGLTPIIADLANKVSDYLDDAGRQEELQRRVNAVVKDGTEIVKGLAGGLRAVKSVVDPLVGAMGGLERTVKAATLVWVAFKVKALAGFAGTALASRTTSARMIADAAAAGRAWDVATRPRNLVVTTTATGTAAGGGRGRGGGLVGGLATTAAITAGFLFGPEVAERIRSGGEPLSAEDVARSNLSEADIRRAGEAGLIEDPERAIRLQRQFRKRVAAAPKFDFGLGGFTSRARQGGQNTTTRTSGDGTSGSGLTRFQRLTLASDQASLTASLQDDLTAARNLEAYYARVAANEKLKGDKLFQARQDLIAAQQRTQGIEDQIAADRQAAADVAATRRKERAEKARRAREKADAQERAQLERDYRNQLIDAGASIRNPNLVRGERGGRRSAQMRAVRDAAAREDGLTAADVRRMHTEFLAGLQGMLNQFGGNLTSDNTQTATNTWQTSKLMVEQNRMLDRLTRGVQHPGSKYARNEMMLGFGGVGSV